MEEQLLMVSFTNLPTIKRVELWDSRIGLPIQRFDADPELKSGNPTVAVLHRESGWNFVQSRLESARYKTVLPVLEKLFLERVEMGYALFQCHLMLNRLSKTANTLEVLLDLLSPGLASLLPRAELVLANWSCSDSRAMASTHFAS